jgi:DNA replication and repair protein RecF
MLTGLHLHNFRCHAERHCRGLGRRMAWIGPNGRGKTSILEAVHVLARVRSFRTHQNRELIAWGASAFGVAGEFGGLPFQRLKVVWSPEERVLEIDGKPAATFRDYWGRCLVAPFQNTDRQLVQGAAALRRQWADGLAAALDPAYLPALQAAQLLLRQKNALLRQDAPDQAVWDSLTHQLRRHGGVIAAARLALTAAAAPRVQAAYARLGGGRETLGLRLLDETSRQMARADAELWARETALRTARLGPHRDDWEIELDGRPLRQFGSEGQQKSAVLALRFAEAELIRQARGAWPLVLIDDAVNELDAARQEAFWALLPEAAQVFLATTRADHLPAGAGFVEAEW